MGTILSLERLVELVDADRSAGLTIALANGCFDFLHVGHVRYLSASSEEADRLVVAVNDDESVAGAEGAWAPGHSGRGARRARRGIGDGGLRRGVFNGIGLAVAAHPQARGALQGNRLLAGDGSRAGNGESVRRAYGHRRDAKAHSTQQLLTRIAATQVDIGRE